MQREIGNVLSGVPVDCVVGDHEAKQVRVVSVSVRWRRIEHLRQYVIGRVLVLFALPCCLVQHRTARRHKEDLVWQNPYCVGANAIEGADELQDSAGHDQGIGAVQKIHVV